MLSRKRNGAVVVLVAVLMVVLLGFGAFAVDVSQMQAYKSELQRTADAAALAATLQLLHESQFGLANAVAQQYVDENVVMGSPADSVQLTYGISNGTDFTPVTAAQSGIANAFRVSLQSSGDFYLAQMIGGQDFAVNATATGWLPVYATPCVKPWAIRLSDMDVQFPNWDSVTVASLRGMSDSASAKVFVLKSDLPDFAGVVNLPPYFDNNLGVYYTLAYDGNTYTRSISSGCPSVSVGDTLQTKIGPYHLETTNGVLGNSAGLTPICAMVPNPRCYNPSGQVGVAIRIAVIEDFAGPLVGCAKTPLDDSDVYTSPPPAHVLCARVFDVLTFVLTRAVASPGESYIEGSFAGRDIIGPVRGYAQRPILVH